MQKYIICGLIIFSFLFLCGCSQQKEVKITPEENLTNAIELAKQNKFSEAGTMVFLDTESCRGPLRKDVSKVCSDELSIYNLSASKDEQIADNFAQRLFYLDQVFPIDGFISQEEIDKLKTPLKPSIEKDIFKYIQEVNPKLISENENNQNKADALTYIGASMEFNKPLIEVYRAFQHTQLLIIRSINLTDNEIDTLGIKWFSDIGFINQDGKWLYEEKEVNMGDPLPIPDSMKPKKPEVDKEIAVTLEVTPIISESNKVKIQGKTNLPDDMKLSIKLTNESLEYSAGGNIIVENGQFLSEWFSDTNRPVDRLGAGSYKVFIYSLTANAQDDGVKDILGENARNMTGKHIVFDEVTGNIIKYEMTFKIP
jgi:hypothetical protein